MTGRFNLGHFLAVAGCLISPIAMYIPTLLSGWMAGIAIISAAIFRLHRGHWPKPFGGALTGIALLLLGLVLWSILSIVWAHAPEEAIDKLPRFAGLMATGLLLIGVMTRLSSDERSVASRWFVWGFLVTVAIMTMERFADGPIMRAVGPDYDAFHFIMQEYNRGITVLSLLVWPAVLIVGSQWGKGRAIGLWIYCAALVATFTSNAATLGLVLGGILFLAALARRRVAALAAAGFIGIAVLASPFVHSTLPDPKMMLEDWEIPRSAYARLLIWSFASDRVAERPILGWGFNGSRSIPGGADRLDESEPALPLHPHNAALQWWLELGVIGAMLGLLLPGLLCWRLAGSRAPPGAPEAAIGALVAACCICFLAYGIWQSWWMAALWLIAGWLASIVTAREMS